MEKQFFASLKSLKKGVGSEFVRQRYESADPNLDPHQNVTDPQHCFPYLKFLNLRLTGPSSSDNTLYCILINAVLDLLWKR
jgi:hypothetical protein